MPTCNSAILAKRQAAEGKSSNCILVYGLGKSFGCQTAQFSYSVRRRDNIEGIAFAFAEGREWTVCFCEQTILRK